MIVVVSGEVGAVVECLTRRALPAMGGCGVCASDLALFRDVKPAPMYVTAAWLMDAVSQRTCTPQHREEHDVDLSDGRH